MSKKRARILILEDDACFRGILEGICSEIGESIPVADNEAALGHLTKKSFDLLLLDWHLQQSKNTALIPILDSYQPNIPRVFLFTVPDLTSVISAMKEGASDILWPAQDRETIRTKITESLLKARQTAFGHSFVSRIAETLTEKALIQKTSLFEARREFSKNFLQQVMNEQNMKRTDVASLMNVSLRTLHRHLSA